MALKIERNRKFKIGDTVILDDKTGKVVELCLFKPDGKGPEDFPYLYGSFCCGVVFENSTTATYHFEKNLKIAPKQIV